MLSDEMTTGSVTTSDADKRAYAARSHAWNIEQRRFKEAFPDVSIIMWLSLGDLSSISIDTDIFSQYCTPTAKDLPNMGQKELGTPSTPSLPPVGIPLTFSLPTAPIAPVLPQAQAAPPSGNNNAVAIPPYHDSRANVVAGWGTSLRQIIWEKWRWGVVLVLAVIVSRLSSTS